MNEVKKQQKISDIQESVTGNVGIVTGRRVKKPIPKLEIKTAISEIDNMYAQNDMSRFSMLVSGYPKTGKTRLLLTCPRPILIYSFDPKGTLILREAIKEGWCKVMTYWGEHSQEPSEYFRFEEDFERHIEQGFFNYFGTVCIDSFTFFMEALTNQTAEALGDVKMGEKGTKQKRILNLPHIGDYRVIYNTTRDVIKLASNEDCNFVMTSHLETYENELTKEVSTDILTYKKLKGLIPAMFTENYIMTTKDTADGPKHWLQTKTYGRFKAGSQLGNNDVFDLYEPPDIKALMKKAGLEVKDKAIKW